ncbi:hypothetical protein HYQ45_014414 [Verticillium longisporum]|uniref:GPI anchored protein n=3 Tax=Verticillium TaxID=1036719 RepID=G2WQF4_VERDV|nr:uncharacterized protein VDAG_00596 [Verticillium dahliae VdLs.17]KAF3350704.1 Alpha-galactosidase [Verticillium dahliae VDG2]KAG7121674.1 hypothetical protein HYQ45_014414 [Verticillium longisporum]KAH6710387.1 hypothetical protein EV126DRAFT_396673 [Verticillium dahliae]EGY13914.1 hypothetical protein VDAG_00596 [Verticillium dahliae VdLs.17]PNH33357.1 hypothetical protein BJF96_g3410 [Verticillium dahliae]
MFHNASKLALLAVFGVAAAEEAVISLFIPLFAPNYVVASVVDVGADETTFALACHSQVPQTECGISNPVQLVAGPSTMALTATLDYTSAPSMTITADCAINVDANEATCTQYQAEGSMTYSESTVVSEIDAYYLPLTITAGAEKLTDVPAATTTPATLPTATETSTGTSATPADSSSESSDESSVVAGESSTTTAAGEAVTTTEAGNTALPRMTQNAVLAGIAAVVGGAMVL